MATRLKQLRVNRIDVVDKSANQHAHIVLFKRAEPVTKDEGGTPRTVNQLLAEREAREQWWDLQRALECSVQEIMEHATPEAQAALLTQTLGEFSAKALALIPQMHAGMAKRVRDAVEDIAKAGRVIAANRLERLKAAMAALSQIIREAEPEEKDDDMADAELEKRAKDAEAETAALKQQLEEATAKLAKGDPEALAKRLAEAEKAVEIEKAKREEREYTEIAKGFSTLPIKADEDWRVFKAIDGLEASTRDRLLELLHAADGQLERAGAFATVGKGGERRGGSSAWDEAQGLAQGLVAKSADLSLNAAMEQVWREHPALYDRYRKETQQRT